MKINAASLFPRDVATVTLDAVGLPLQTDVGGGAIVAHGISDVAVAD